VAEAAVAVAAVAEAAVAADGNARLHG
jgi:hypothetical protein